MHTKIVILFTEHDFNYIYNICFFIDICHLAGFKYSALEGGIRFEKENST